MILEPGRIYQLNNAVARIVEMSDDEVIWTVPKVRGRLTHHPVPRWFFEKHATPVPNGHQNSEAT